MVCMAAMPNHGIFPPREASPTRILDLPDKLRQLGQRDPASISNRTYSPICSQDRTYNFFYATYFLCTRLSTTKSRPSTDRIGRAI